MLMNNIITNLNYFDKVLKEKAIVDRNKTSAGYADIFHIILALGIIVAFSVVIAYLLYSIK